MSILVKTVFLSWIMNTQSCLSILESELARQIMTARTADTKVEPGLLGRTNPGTIGQIGFRVNS